MLIWILHPSNARITGMKEGLDLHENRCPWLLNFSISHSSSSMLLRSCGRLCPRTSRQRLSSSIGVSQPPQSLRQGLGQTEMVCRFLLDAVHELEQTVTFGLSMLMIYRTVRGWLWARRPSFAVPLLPSPNDFRLVL